MLCPVHFAPVARFEKRPLRMHQGDAVASHFKFIGCDMVAYHMFSLNCWFAALLRSKQRVFASCLQIMTSILDELDALKPEYDSMDSGSDDTESEVRTRRGRRRSDSDEDREDDSDNDDSDNDVDVDDGDGASAAATGDDAENQLTASNSAADRVEDKCNDEDGAAAGAGNDEDEVDLTSQLQAASAVNVDVARAPRGTSSSSISPMTSQLRENCRPTTDDLRRGVIACEAVFFSPMNTPDGPPAGSFKDCDHATLVLLLDSDECINMSWGQVGLRVGHAVIKDCFASTPYRLCDERPRSPLGNTTADTKHLHLARAVSFQNVYGWAKDYANKTVWRMSDVHKGVNCEAFVKQMLEFIIFTSNNPGKPFGPARTDVVKLDPAVNLDTAIDIDRDQSWRLLADSGTKYKLAVRNAEVMAKTPSGMAIVTQVSHAGRLDANRELLCRNVIAAGECLGHDRAGNPIRVAGIFLLFGAPSGRESLTVLAFAPCEPHALRAFKLSEALRQRERALNADSELARSVESPTEEQCTAIEALLHHQVQGWAEKNSAREQSNEDDQAFFQQLEQVSKEELDPWLASTATIPDLKRIASKAKLHLHGLKIKKDIASVLVVGGVTYDDWKEQFPNRKLAARRSKTAAKQKSRARVREQRERAAAVRVEKERAPAPDRSQAPKLKPTSGAGVAAGSSVSLNDIQQIVALAVQAHTKTLQNKLDDITSSSSTHDHSADKSRSHSKTHVSVVGSRSPDPSRRRAHAYEHRHHHKVGDIDRSRSRSGSPRRQSLVRVHKPRYHRSRSPRSQSRYPHRRSRSRDRHVRLLDHTMSRDDMYFRDHHYGHYSHQNHAIPLPHMYTYSLSHGPVTPASALSYRPTAKGYLAYPAGEYVTPAITFPPRTYAPAPMPMSPIPFPGF